MKIDISSVSSKIRKIQLTPRKQAGAIPFTITPSGKVKFLLVRKTGSGKWGFPKGKIEMHLGKRGSASMEAWEEAGVKGTLLNEVGQYHYIKNKTSRLQQVDLYLLEVSKVKRNYLETEREREWFSFGQASKVLQKTQLPFLKLALRIIQEIN